MRRDRWVVAIIVADGCARCAKHLTAAPVLGEILSRGAACVIDVGRRLVEGQR